MSVDAADSNPFVVAANLQEVSDDTDPEYLDASVYQGARYDPNCQWARHANRRLEKLEQRKNALRAALGAISAQQRYYIGRMHGTKFWAVAFAAVISFLSGVQATTSQFVLEMSNLTENYDATQLPLITFGFSLCILCLSAFQALFLGLCKDAKWITKAQQAAEFRDYGLLLQEKLESCILEVNARRQREHDPAYEDSKDLRKAVNSFIKVANKLRHGQTDRTCFQRAAKCWRTFWSCKWLVVVKDCCCCFFACKAQTHSGAYVVVSPRRRRSASDFGE